MMDKSNYQILVIEDDYKIRNVVVDILEEEGYEVFSSMDGKTGIKIAKSIKPTVVICDIMLPDITGYEICYELRETEKTKNSVFIFLTAKVEGDDLRKGMNCGADDYLFKPFKTVDLLNSVKTRIKKYQNLFDTQNNNTSILTAESKLFIKNNNSTKIIKVSDITAISADGVYSEIRTKAGSKYIYRKSLNEWEKNLPTEIFERIHRSYIINITTIEKIEPWLKNSYSVKLENVDQKFTISERYSSKLKKKFSF